MKLTRKKEKYLLNSSNYTHNKPSRKLKGEEGEVSPVR